MPLTLLAVHAHPDDESINTGGVLARYAAEGVRTVLVTCTGGEMGEISDPTLATPETLASVRARELAEATRILGVADCYMLGYRDSGMMGTPANDDPRAFWRADLDEATARRVAIVRRTRPDVLLCDDDSGSYGHPDHINSNRIAVAAFHAAGDPARYPEQGPAPWTPRKLYYFAWPRSAMRRLRALLTEAGLPNTFDDEREGEPEDFGAPDEEITTWIDVTAYVAQKREALAAHRTQMPRDSFFMRMPLDIWQRGWNTEAFRLITSHVPAPAHEDDLFAGLR